MSKQDFLDTRVGKGSIRGSAYQSDTFIQSVMNFAYSSILPRIDKREVSLNDNRTNRIEQLDDGRFISCHRSGVEIYYDRRHRITKVKCEGGVIMELVQEYQQHTGTLRKQMVLINSHGTVSLKTESL